MREPDPPQGSGSGNMDFEVPEGVREGVPARCHGLAKSGHQMTFRGFGQNRGFWGPGGVPGRGADWQPGGAREAHVILFFKMDL